MRRVGVCVCVLVTSRFQPPPHCWLAVMRKGELYVSLPLPVHSLPRGSRRILGTIRLQANFARAHVKTRLDSLDNSSRRENSYHKPELVYGLIPTTMLAPRHEVEVGLEANHLFP